MRAVFGLSAALLLASAAAAQDAPPPAGDRPMTRDAAVARVDERFAKMDLDGNGVITRAEYDQWRQQRVAARGGDAAARPHGGRGGHGDRMFTMLDRNGDGQITRDEAHADAARMFDMMDTNHDGTISPDEREAARGLMGGHWGDHGGKHGGGEPAPADQ